MNIFLKAYNYKYLVTLSLYRLTVSYTPTIKNPIILCIAYVEEPCGLQAERPDPPSWFASVPGQKYWLTNNLFTAFYNFRLSKNVVMGPWLYRPVFRLENILLIQL